MTESTLTPGDQGAPPASPSKSHSLAKGRLGVVGIVFFVVAAAAPLVGMTGGVPVAIALGNGAAVPGAYVAVGIILVVFGASYAAMSQVVTNAGAFFAYVGAGLGRAAGVGSAMASLVAYLAIQLSIFGFFGAQVAGRALDSFGIDLPWWAWALAAWAAVLALSLLSVDVGAKVLGTLMVCELASLAVVVVAVLADGGGPDGFGLGASLSPQHVFAGGFAGSAGIALAYAFASFIGFEATAIYAEETDQPRHAVPQATFAAVAVITVIFVMGSWAVVSGLGTSSVVDETLRISSVGDVPLADPAAVIFHVADTYVGHWLSEVMGWLVISSLFAGLLAFQNCAARYFFVMGRAGALPSALTRTTRLQAPVAGSLVTSALTVLVILVFVVADLDPVLNLFYWCSALAVIAIVVVEILVCAAVFRYFRLNPGGALWSTVVAPVLAAVGLFCGLYLLTSHFGLLAGTVQEGVDPSTESWGLNATGWLLVLLPFAALAVGTVLGWLRRDHISDDLRL